MNYIFINLLMITKFSMAEQELLTLVENLSSPSPQFLVGLVLLSL
jgi:hypothetical protein